MSRVTEKIKLWGQKNLGKSEISVILKHMRNGRAMSQKGIADAIGCSVPTIRNFLEKDNLLGVRSKFIERIKVDGYKDLAAFFKDPKNTKKTMREIARDLGVCYPTVSKYYYMFEEESKKKP
jgi:predicted transcriptional regulator